MYEVEGTYQRHREDNSDIEARVDLLQRECDRYRQELQHERARNEELQRDLRDNIELKTRSENDLHRLAEEVEGYKHQMENIRQIENVGIIESVVISEGLNVSARPTITPIITEIG